ncbi:MAG: DUF669 domain-containing protein [Lentisphaeria bacterium]|nr:DUF669 domain-containing protein [Lentisphaeria bacterium]
MATFNFNANEVEPNSGFTLMPAGKYLAVITEDEMKDTKSGDGRYLSLTFEVLDGKFKGRKLWARLNLENKNAQAVQIARGDLSAICRAVGVMQLSDTVQLHNIPLVITVKVKRNRETDEMQNEISGYEPKGTATAVTAAQPAAKAPWAR